jgi:hypothetical protein
MDTQSTISVDLTESELAIVKNALEAFLTDFGHDEADVLHEIHLALAKINAVAQGVSP